LAFPSAFLLASILATSAPAHAAKGGSGGFELGFVGGVTSTTQDYLNLAQSRANVSAGGISTPSLTSAYEAGLQMGYRFNGSIFAILLRPTFFYQKAAGGNAAGDYNYGVTGFTVFPMLRLIPLENSFMRFFMQIGLGYGRATTTVKELDNELTAVGNSFGAQVGLGSEFCFTAAHCMSVEMNYRYLNMERNIVSDSTEGTGFNSARWSQTGKNKELEADNDDVTIRMGGLQFLLGYAMHF
jgi:outer membrane protein W